MGAFPSSESPGLRLLHERAVMALDRRLEAQDVEFKESMAWDDLKKKVVAPILGMANLRDGGIVLVGVGTRDKQIQLDGISDTDLETYDVDHVADYVAIYASPAVRFDMAIVSYQAKRFLAVHVQEFEHSPVVCRKTLDGQLMQGAVYVRPAGGKAQTTRVMDAAQMSDLLDLAAEKRARRLLEAGRRVGLVPQQAAADLFDRELEGL